MTGNHHLHILVRLWNELRTRDRRQFDFVCKKHGDYRPAKSIYAVSNYLRKSDSTPLIFGDIPEPGSKQAQDQLSRKKARKDGGNQSESKATTIAKLLLSGSTTNAVMMKDPGYYLLQKRKIEEFSSLCAIHRLKETLQPWPGQLKYEGTCPAVATIIEWLNSNIACRRPFREKQLFINGPKMCYKTTVVLLLRKYLTVYDIPKGEDFYDLYDDEAWGLAYLDEFKGQKTIQWLNEWLQGGPMNLRQKGKQYLKQKNIATIVTANWTLPQIYANSLAKDPNKIDTLESRFIQVHLESALDIRGFAEALGLATCDVMNDLIVEDETRFTSSRQATTGTSPSPGTRDQLLESVRDEASLPTEERSLQAFRKRRRKEKEPQKEFCKSCGEEEQYCKCLEQDVFNLVFSKD